MIASLSLSLSTIWKIFRSLRALVCETTIVDNFCCSYIRFPEKIRIELVSSKKMAVENSKISENNNKIKVITILIIEFIMWLITSFIQFRFDETFPTYFPHVQCEQQIIEKESWERIEGLVVSEKCRRISRITERRKKRWKNGKCSRMITKSLAILDTIIRSGKATRAKLAFVKRVIFRGRTVKPTWHLFPTRPRIYSNEPALFSPPSEIFFFPRKNLHLIIKIRNIVISNTWISIN